MQVYESGVHAPPNVSEHVEEFSTNLDDLVEAVGTNAAVVESKTRIRNRAIMSLVSKEGSK